MERAKEATNTPSKASQDKSPFLFFLSRAGKVKPKLMATSHITVSCTNAIPDAITARG